MAETRTTKDIVRSILLSAEMGAKGDQDAYKLSDAENGNSGWSVGRTQIDLGQQTDKHGEFNDLLKKSGTLTDQEIGTVMDDLGSTQNNKKMSARLQGKVNGVLASQDGKAMLDRWDEGQVEAMTATVDEARAAARENPRYANDLAFRNQVDSPAFAGAIAGHANQYENSPRMKEWLRGNEIEVNGTKVKLGDKIPDIDAVADIETNSRYLKKSGKEDPKNIVSQHTRWQAIVGQLERHGDITAEEAKAMRGTVRDRYSTEEQRRNRQDPKQHEVEAGQNFSTIAKQKGLSLEDLQRANPDKVPTKLKPGEFLRVPTPDEIEQWKREKARQDLSTLRPEPRPQADTGSGQEPPAQPPRDTAPQPGAPKQEPAPEIKPEPGSALEQKRSEPPADPKVTAMVEMAGAPVDNPGKAALLKPVETLTQSEMTDMINSAQGDYRGWRSGDPLKAHTYEKVQDWHVAMYGDGPQANDGGKPVDPSPIRAIPDQPSPHLTPQGEDLWQATGRLGGKVAEAAGTDGADNAVKSLQRGLNMLNDAKPLPARSAAYAPYTKLGPVAEDGAYGPQTDFALKHATARLGPSKVEEAFALGRFNTFAREAQRSGNAEGLEAKTHAAFGPLFRDPADTQAPKLEGGALQETLNNLGPRGQDDWAPLKVDNWIGPKTTEAFGKVLQSEDADGITAAFGRGLGFL